MNSFVTTNVPLVLFAIGVESPRFSLSQRSVSSAVRLQRTDELPRTKQLVNEIVNSLVRDLDRNWQVKLKSRLRLQIHVLSHETYQFFITFFRQVQLLKAIRNIHTPDSIFVVTNVPFVLIAIGVESH